MSGSPTAPSPPRVDVHVHLAGVGTGSSGCWVSPAFRRRATFLGLRLLYGISDRQLRTTIDQDWAALLSRLVRNSELDLAAVLGFDGVYDEAGRLDPGRSQLIVPPDWVFKVCESHPFLAPAPSINPYRRDALERLDEAIARGAVMLKWLPIVQGFDPQSRRIEPFLRRAADARIPILVHAGSGEVTFRTVDPSVGDVERLIPALELGVPVICAHSAAPIHYSRQPSQLPRLRTLLRRYPNLWVDNAGIANPSRFLHLPRLARDPLLRERTLHGSDFPVISSTVFYLRRLGFRTSARIERVRNPLQREVEIKRAVGFPESALTRAAEVLINLDRWHRAIPPGQTETTEG